MVWVYIHLPEQNTPSLRHHISSHHNTLTVSAPPSDPSLRPVLIARQIVVLHLEVSELDRPLLHLRQIPGQQELQLDGLADLLGVGNTQLVSHGLDQPPHFHLEIRGVVDHLVVRVAHPRLSDQLVVVDGGGEVLGPGVVVGPGVVLLRPPGRGDQVDHVVVPVVPQVHLVELTVLHDLLPVLPGQVGGAVHGSPVTNDETVPVLRASQGEVGVLQLQHCLQQVLLEVKPLLVCEEAEADLEKLNVD